MLQRPIPCTTLNRPKPPTVNRISCVVLCDVYGMFYVKRRSAENRPFKSDLRKTGL